MKNYLLSNRTPRRRRGATLVITVFFLTVMLAFVAMVVDLGYLANARAELQRTADAAAMAACWEYAQQLSSDTTHSTAAQEGYGSAEAACNDNDVCNTAPAIESTDVTWGRLNDFYDRHEVMDTSNPDDYNAVRVSVRRTAAMNGRVPVFFAKVFGVGGIDVNMSATAAIVRGVDGFQTPSDNSNLEILPITLDLETWTAMLGGTGADQWRWTPGDKPGEGTVSRDPNGDGILEINLYPIGNDSPGNRGTVDIGSPNNSTSTIERQILDGITPADMSYFENGRLEFDENHEMPLNGDTGISAGIKDELAAIIGECRMIPIFSKVQSPGNNAVYTIVDLVGIRIMDVKLTGNKTGKRVIIQMAPMSSLGLIPGSPTDTNINLFSPVVLVR